MRTRDGRREHDALDAGIGLCGGGQHVARALHRGVYEVALRVLHLNDEGRPAGQA